MLGGETCQLTPEGATLRVRLPSTSAGAVFGETRDQQGAGRGAGDEITDEAEDSTHGDLSHFQPSPGTICSIVLMSDVPFRSTRATEPSGSSTLATPGTSDGRGYTPTGNGGGASVYHSHSVCGRATKGACRAS